VALIRELPTPLTLITGRIGRGIGVVVDDDGVGAGKRRRPRSQGVAERRRADELAIVIQQEGRGDRQRVGALRREGERAGNRVAIHHQRPRRSARPTGRDHAVGRLQISNQIGHVQTSTVAQGEEHLHGVVGADDAVAGMGGIIGDDLRAGGNDKAAAVFQNGQGGRRRRHQGCRWSG